MIGLSEREADYALLLLMDNNQSEWLADICFSSSMGIALVFHHAQWAEIRPRENAFLRNRSWNNKTGKAACQRERAGEMPYCERFRELVLSVLVVVLHPAKGFVSLLS